MYCKYCGKEVKQGTQYCPHCGREIARKGGKAGKAGGAFYLLLGISVSPLLFTFLRAQGNWFNVIRGLVVSAIGIAVILFLCQSGKIDPSRFRSEDVVMWLLWIYLPSLASTWIWRIYIAFGQSALMAYSIMTNIEFWFGCLGGLWTWIELAVLCMARSGRLKITGKKVALTLVVLMAWSALSSVLCGPFAERLIGWEADVLNMVLQGSRLYFLLMWLRRGFELAFMTMYGGDRLSPGFGALVPVILNLLLVILTPVTVFGLGFGIIGTGLSAAGAYSFSSLALFLLRVRHTDLAEK